MTRVTASSFHHYNEPVTTLKTGNYCKKNITFSRNVFLSNHQGKYKSFRLNIKQLKGPFNSLDASWKVVEKDLGCLVIFSVEFNAPILLRPFMQQSLIDTFASKFISAFLKKVS